MINAKKKEAYDLWFDNSLFTNNESKLIFNTIIWPNYNEKNRFYHNISHIIKCINLLNKTLVEYNFGAEYSSICFALWMHDIIYDTTSFDNEEKSAEIANNILRYTNGSNKFLNPKLIESLILSTKNHMDHKDINFQLMSDIDLSILGAEPKEYQEYYRNIRKEYSWANINDYCSKRKLILESFLGRPKIYSILTNFEQQARKNIENELEALSVLDGFF